MIDIFVIIALAETSLLDISKQVSGLAMGLDNAAPSDKIDAPNKSVQYLYGIAECLSELSGKCRKLLAHENKEQDTNIDALIREAVQQDKDLREKYQVKDKFRFIRDRLNALLANVEETLASMKKEITEKVKTVSDDEMLVYVYLFNAQGIALQTWHKMVNPAVFYEHSVNRPIYIEKAHIESFISKKANKVQYGYLTVAIKKQDISKVEGVALLKDIYDHPLVKVKEGSLQFNKLVSFTHNGIDYVVNEEGELIKKI